MSKKTKQATAKTLPEAPSQAEKYLGFGFIFFVGLSVVAVLVILLAAFSNGAWIPTGLGLVPMLAMPFGFLCLAALLLLSGMRRRKANSK